MSNTSGCDRARTLVIHENDATRTDNAFRHLECRRDRAIGKQSFSTAQRNRKYLQPQPIDQIMLEERLNEICASYFWGFASRKSFTIGTMMGMRSISVTCVVLGNMANLDAERGCMSPKTSPPFKRNISEM